MSLITNKKKAKLAALVFKTLQDGVMPSAFDIKKWIRKNDHKYPSNEPAKFSRFYVDGNPLNPGEINSYIAEYKEDMKAIYQTIEDGWSKLDDILIKSIALSNIYDAASTLNKSVRNTLSKIDTADEFYNVNIIGNGISSSDWDLSMSENIVLDQQAGTISLSKTSAVSIDKEKMSVKEVVISSEGQFGYGKTFGNMSNIFDANIANRYIQFIESKEIDLLVNATFIINISTAAADNVMNELNIYTYGKHDMVCTVWTSYDGKNYSKFGDAIGNGKIIIIGEPVNVNSIKVEISKFKNDSMIDGKPSYIFDIAEIDVMISSYTDVGYAISNPISNENEIISAGISFDGTNNDSIKFYIGNDVGEAKSKNDFMWKLVSQDMDWVAQQQVSSNIIPISNPSKYFNGPGATSDIWKIYDTEDTIFSAEEGYNQVEVRYKTVSYATTANVSRLDFEENSPHKYVSGLGDIRLIPSQDDSFSYGTNFNPNYYHIITRFYTEFSTSAEFIVDNSFSKFKIYINGADVSSLIRNNYISIPLSVGENKMEIVVLKDEDDEDVFKFTPKNNTRCAITRLEISTKDSMSADNTPRICLHDGNVIVNRYTKDKTYRIFTMSATSEISSTVRLMAEIIKTEGGASPTLRQVVLKTGV